MWENGPSILVSPLSRYPDYTALKGKNVNMLDVRDTGQALAYITDCTLATVTDLASRTRPPKNELKRQINIAQKAIDWMDAFGVDYSKTRAAEVKVIGGTVEKWASKFQQRA